MWILHFLPDSFIQFIVHTILIVGIIGTFLSFFVINKILRWMPGLSKYATIAQVISAALLVAGVYFEGGYSTEMQWRERVAELEDKLNKAEQQSKEVNVKIETKVVTKTKIIKERGEDIVKYVDREVVKYDVKFAPGGVCEIPKEFIKAHNDAAEAPKK
jgi:hypothetical protein